MNEKYQKVIEVLGKERVRLNEPLSSHTTFKIGGPADLYYEAKSETELALAIKAAREQNLPYFLLGKGSNILAGDKGFRGLAIKMGIETFEAEDEKVLAGAGLPLSQLVNLATQRGLAGLEFMAGIPGSVGGAVVGNAGAWRQNIGNKVVQVKIFTPEGARWVSAKESRFGYRCSRFKEGQEIILLVELKLKPDNPQEIRKRIEEILAKRSSQPQEPSAGCIFVNPKPQSAGGLIEAAGLKGARIGGAQVSEKHANFIINTGGATANDVLALSNLVKGKVKDEFGIDLKEEIVKIGEF